jgi:beta-glucuronidase
MGDKGSGALKQRVHGVVDVYGNRKPSYTVLRRESSPVATLKMSRSGQTWSAALTTRDKVPCYTLRGYTLRFTLYGFGGLPMEQKTVALPVLEPGASAHAAAEFSETKPVRVVVEIVRPTGSTVLAEEWTA